MSERQIIEIPQPPELEPLPMAAEGERKVGVFDEIRVGKIVITKTADGGAGIWFGSPHQGHMISIFDCSGQVGVGIYTKGANGPTNICLVIDPKDGSGSIQFAQGKEHVNLDFDDVKKLLEAK